MSDTLMKKTKKELVDIIFRKDDVHKKLKEDNDALNNKLETLIKLNNDKDVNLAHKNNEIANLVTQVNEYIDMCDEYASRCQEIVNSCNKFKNLAILSVCIMILVLILMFILL